MFDPTVCSSTMSPSAPDVALHALGIDAASIVLGHPTALPAAGELYGLPSVWPRAIAPSPRESSRSSTRSVRTPPAI